METTSAEHHTPPHDWGWLLAATLPLFGILPTLYPGMMDAADAPLHVQRIFAMGTLLGEGQLYPRWVPWFHLGYGYPVFNFYPPGVFYLGGLLMQAGLTAVNAFHIIASLAWVFGTVGTYRLARRILPPGAALLAAALWAYAPSRLFEVWTQGSLPQMASAAFIPWALHAVIGAAFSPSRRWAVWLGLALAGLVLTHQPITFITALYVAPLTLILVLTATWGHWRTLPGRAGAVYGGVVLGAGLSAIFLLPLALELPLVDGVRGTDDVVGYLASNFPPAFEIISQPTPPDLTDLRTYYPRTLGLLGVVLFGMGALRLLWERRFGLAALLLAGLGFTVFMMLPVSTPVWLGVPFLAQLRFPERFLRFGAVVIALGGGAALLWLPGRARAYGAALATILVIAAALPQTVPSQPFVELGQLTAADEIQFERDTYAWGTTSYNEFNPHWGEDIPLDDPGNINRYRENPTHLTPDNLSASEYLGPGHFRVTVTEPGFTLHIRQFYFPGWQVTVNGERTEIFPEDRHGLLALNLPPGEHTIQARYRGTAAQWAGTVVTLVSVVLALGLAQTSRPAAPPQTPGYNPPTPIILALSICLVVLAAGYRWWVLPETDWLRRASPPDAPAYMATARGDVFGGQFELIGYTLPRQTITPVRPLHITLYWRPTPGFDGARLRPVVQLVNLPVTETWAVSQPFFPGGDQTDNSVYTPQRFTSDPHTLRLFDHAQPYAAHVMIQLFDVRTDEPLLLPDGSDRVLLTPPINVNLPPEPVNRYLAYVFDDTVELWCKSVDVDDDQIHLTLYWHLRGPLADDLITMVHGLDQRGEIVAQGDAPPVPAYPTSLWRTGQTVRATYQLPSARVQRLAVGLYRADGPRLPVVGADGVPLPQGQVILPLLPSDC